jgi:hypothetical protein
MTDTLGDHYLDEPPRRFDYFCREGHRHRNAAQVRDCNTIGWINLPAPPPEEERVLWQGEASLVMHYARLHPEARRWASRYLVSPRFRRRSGGEGRAPSDVSPSAAVGGYFPTASREENPRQVNTRRCPGAPAGRTWGALGNAEQHSSRDPLRRILSSDSLNALAYGLGTLSLAALAYVLIEILRELLPS